MNLKGKPFTKKADREFKLKLKFQTASKKAANKMKFLNKTVPIRVSRSRSVQRKVKKNLPFFCNDALLRIPLPHKKKCMPAKRHQKRIGKIQLGHLRVIRLNFCTATKNFVRCSVAND